MTPKFTRGGLIPGQGICRPREPELQVLRTMNNVILIVSLLVLGSVVVQLLAVLTK